MTQVEIKHQIRDFNIWKRVYDATAPMRKAQGCIGAEVLCSSQNPNEIIVRYVWEDAEKALAFVGSSDLGMAMGHAGVIGQLEITFLNPVEQTVF
jgi:quinol monooxygenase YgiN